MHMFVPVLPEVARDLNTSAAAAQGTLSLYIFGLAVGQLFYGPMADRFGRRPILILGLVLYTAAGYAAAFSPNIDTLLVARLVQALGGCTGLILGRAMVRDTAPPDASMRRQASINLLILMGPGISPIIGSALAAAFGWRSIFIALATLGLLNLILIVTLLPETGIKKASNFRAMVRDYGKLLVSKHFNGFAIGGACSTTSIYGFIAAGPFIYGDDFHRPGHEIGFYIGLTLVGAALGSVITGWLSSRVSIARIMTGGNVLCILSAIVLLVGALTGQATLYSTIGLSIVFAAGAGIAGPAALTSAMSVNPLLIGTAAGLYGFAQMLVGSICTALAGLGSDRMISAVLVLTGASLLGQLSFFIAQRRHSRPA